jgi:glycerol kinase
MVLAIDQGTTGTTCLVFDDDMAVAGRAYREFTQHFPRPGWVEHDLDELWSVTQAVALEALEDAGVPDGGLRAIGITNQRETVCAWDRATGEPLHRALVWQDRRTAARCDELRDAGYEPYVRACTGLVLDPYFSATKIEWLVREGGVDPAGACFGTVDAWVVHKLTGEFATDPTNASRTLLYDVREGRWSDELCALFGVDPASLPEVRPSVGDFGRTTPEGLPGWEGVPVCGIAGDQQAALYGQACLDPGMAKNTYGTGSFVLLNTGDERTVAPPGLLSTIAWQVGERVSYALEASIFVTGAAVQWLRDGLGIISEAAETEGLARSLEDNDGVYFVPALTGLGSPHWDPYARGTITGLTRGNGRAHLARAALEAMAYQTLDAVQAMTRAAGEPLRELRADGGASDNDWLMQFQADVLGVPVVVPEVRETTAMGAALLAAVGAGALSQADVTRAWRERARFEPAMADDERERLVAGWRDALGRARNG